VVGKVELGSCVSEDFQILHKEGSQDILSTWITVYIQNQACATVTLFCPIARSDARVEINKRQAILVPSLLMTIMRGTYRVLT
jgi:hypothetical protein